MRTRAHHALAAAAVAIGWFALGSSNSARTVLFTCVNYGLLGWIMRAFKAGLTVTMACEEHMLEWSPMRTRRFVSVAMFPPDKIAEIDELYLPSLQPDGGSVSRLVEQRVWLTV